MSKGSDDQTTTSEPWGPQQGYLESGFEQARQLYNTGGPQYFPNATYVPFSEQTEQGLGLMQDRALSGSPQEQAFRTHLNQMLGTNTSPMMQQLLQPMGMGQAQNWAGPGRTGQQAMRNLLGVQGPSSGFGAGTMGMGPGTPAGYSSSGNIAPPAPGPAQDALRGAIPFAVDPRAVQADPQGFAALQQAYATGAPGTGMVGGGPAYAQNTLQGLAAQGTQGPGTSGYAGMTGFQSRPGYADQALQNASATGNLQQAQQAAGVGINPLAGFAGRPMSLDAAQGYAQGSPELGATIQGDYLGSNPYLDQVYDTAASRMTENFQDTIIPGLQSRFAMGGGSGSGIEREIATDAAGELGQNLAELGANVYAPAYESERNRQLQALGIEGDRLGLGADLFSRTRGQNIDAATGMGAQDLARRGQALDYYLGERGLSTDAAQAGLNAYLGERGQALDARRAGNRDLLDAFGLGTQRGGLSLDAARTALSDDLGRFQAGGDLYTNLQRNMINASQGLLSDDLARQGLAADIYNMQGNLGLGALGQANQAATMVPTSTQLDYNNIRNLLGVGSTVEDKSREVLQDQMNRFNYGQNQPYNNLANYIAAIQGNYGGTTTQDIPQGGGLTGALGGAATGAGLAQALSLGTPWGWALGGLGALGGLL